jgi:hypothetical protein
MSEQLTRQEVERAIESLEYKRRSIEDYPVSPTGYPSYEFKLSQLEQVNNDLKKFRALRSELRKKEAVGQK